MHLRNLARCAPILLLVAGCSDADVEKMRRVGDKTYDRVSLVAQQVADELGQTLLDQKPSVTTAPVEPGVEEKVRQRLAWDRELAELAITVTVEGDTVTLKGTIKSDVQKRRAVELAESTVGARKVIADLDVADAEKPELDPSN